MPRYCPTCNRSSNDIRFHGDFCYDCASRKFLASLPSHAEITKCKRCDRLKIEGRYEPFSAHLLEAIIARGLSRYGVHLLSFDEQSAMVEISKHDSNGTLAVVSNMKLKYSKVLCEQCYKKAANYHEAVMQLRGNRKQVEQFMNAVIRHFEANNEFVSKVEIVDNGVDLYLSSKKMAREYIMRRRLKPTASYTLAGLKGGRKVYKNTYAFHF